MSYNDATITTTGLVCVQVYKYFITDEQSFDVLTHACCLCKVANVSYELSQRHTPDALDS